jgi:D-3-phosphoglycerate dehydrogenase
MPSTTLRVARGDYWIDPTFDARLGQEPSVSLQVFPVRGDPAAGLDALAAAHVYQISAAKDDLPRQWFASEDLLAKCPHLLCVSSTGAGFDTVDVAACTARGILVLSQVGGNADSVAEHALAMMISVSHRLVESDRRMRREHGFAREDVMGHEIRGRTLGLVGIGNVGRRVAKLAKAFGMEVLATDPFVPAEEVAARGATAVSLDDLLARSDFVSLHCPRDAGTLKMMDAGAFARMKKGAIFITTARGGIHDEQALVQALQSGHLAGAGIDVWDREPPPLDHPLLAMDNVFATFHTAGVTHEARRNVAGMAADQLLGLFLRGEHPPRLANPGALPRFDERRRQLLGT